MLVEFSIVPIGAGKTLSSDIAEVIDIVDKSGLDYRLTDMATIVEGDWDEVFGLIKRCHQALLDKEGRLYTRIVVDDVKGAERRLGEKTASVERKVGRKVKK